MNKEMNERLKAIRLHLNLNQKAFSELLNIKQGSLSDIERGRIGVSVKIMELVCDKFGVNPSWFYTGDGDMFNIVKNYKKSQGKNTGGHSGDGMDGQNFTNKFKKELVNFYPYMTRFKEELIKEFPDSKQLSEDIHSILELHELSNKLHDSKIGDVTFWGVDNILKINSFQDFKDIGFKVYENALKHKKMIHEFAEATRKFRDYLQSVKDDIELNYDFEN